MSKVAFVILASGDNPENLGRVVDALMGAYEMMESGHEVKLSLMVRALRPQPRFPLQITSRNL